MHVQHCGDAISVEIQQLTLPNSVEEQVSRTKTVRSLDVLLGICALH